MNHPELFKDVSQLAANYVEQDGKDRFLIPHTHGWAISMSSEGAAFRLFQDKKLAKAGLGAVPIFLYDFENKDTSLLWRDPHAKLNGQNQ